METQWNESSTAGLTTTTLPPATGSSNINLGNSERIVSAFGGAALTIMGLRNIGSLSGITMFLGGGYLLARGLSGYCAISNYYDRKEMRLASGMEAKSTFTVQKPKSEVYAYWRSLENLPNFMKHLETVIELDDKRSKWTAKIPGGVGNVSWEAEIQEEIDGELISWSSLPGSTINNAGQVRFTEVAGGNGTQIEASITYRLPAGDIGAVAAKLFNPAVEKMMRQDLKNFATVLESGSSPAWSENRSQSAPDVNQIGNREEYSVPGIH